MTEESSQFRCGPLPYVEHPGLWKSAPNDPDVTDDEYDRVYEEFSRRLKACLGGWKGLKFDQRCYFIGDFCGDRTQCLQFPDFNMLTPALVRELRQMLQEPRYRQWRIAIGAHSPEEVILIYPSAVCTSRALAEEELDAVVSELADRNVQRDERAEKERLERIDRVRPLLADAYAAARGCGDLALLVSVERGTGKDDGLIRMWIIHPEAEHEFDLHEYEMYPDAVYSEAFHITPDGGIHEESGKVGKEELFLALWEFEENESKTFTLEKGADKVDLSYE